MPKSIHHECTIPTPADQYYRAIADPDFVTAPARQEITGPMRLVDRRDDGPTLYRKYHVEPNHDEYPALSHLPGKSSACEYEEWIARDRLEISWQSKPLNPMVSGRCKIAGKTRVVPEDAARCRRVIDGSIAVSIPFVGGKVEGALVASGVDGFDREAKYLATYDWRTLKKTG